MSLWVLETLFYLSIFCCSWDILMKIPIQIASNGNIVSGNHWFHHVFLWMLFFSFHNYHKNFMWICENGNSFLSLDVIWHVDYSSNPSANCLLTDILSNFNVFLLGLFSSLFVIYCLNVIFEDESSLLSIFSIL